MKIKNARLQWSQERRTTKSVMYFFPSGETLINNIAERRRRPYNEYRKLIPKVCEMVGLNYKDHQFTWSQKAGCSCGCSPGFIIKHLYCKQVFVDVTMDNDFEGLGL